ncbi:MAG: hypothetical protein AAF560_12250 [Acidobacteriota bacterium]
MNLPCRAPWQRSSAIATVLVVLLAGVLPALHHHEDEETCSAAGPSTASHLETLEPAHHELCGLCAKSMSSARLDPPLTELVEALVGEQVAENRRILPPAPTGRHGASRAPPLA